MGYLISLHDNEVDWNLLGIKVIGAIDALPIPDGNYEYGDAYMVGTETPYDMYIYTRPDGEVHTEGYWFPIGKFPMPGPQGPKGDGIDKLTKISLTHDIESGDVYGTSNGQCYDGISTIQYKDSTTGQTKSQNVFTTVFFPIVGSDYINIDTDPNNSRFVVRINDTALALDYVKIDNTKNSVVPLYLNGSVKWSQTTENSAPSSIAYRDANGDCNFHRVTLSPAGFTIDTTTFNKTVMVYGLKSDFSIADQTGGTLTANESYFINNTVVFRLKIQDKVYYRVSEFGKVPVRFMSCDNTGTISILTCDTTNKTYTIASHTNPTYKHVTQMHVVIPGDDDYYLTIFNTDKHGAMYNLNSASTLLDNIGTAGTIAYKQNTANGVYMPVHVSKNPSGNWAWNMGSASGTFTTNQIDLITDDYETI